MPGQMGNETVKVRKLEVVRVSKDCLLVKGSVPGSKNAWLLVRDAVKVSRHAEAPYPAGLKQVANNNDAAPADTPAETVAAVDSAEGQEG